MSLFPLKPTHKPVRADFEALATFNAVYRNFFQRFDTKQADTHGIVYLAKG